MSSQRFPRVRVRVDAAAFEQVVLDLLEDQRVDVGGGARPSRAPRRRRARPARRPGRPRRRGRGAPAPPPCPARARARARGSEVRRTRRSRARRGTRGRARPRRRSRGAAPTTIQLTGHAVLERRESVADGGPVGPVAAHRADLLVAVGAAQAKPVARGPGRKAGRVAVLDARPRASRARRGAARRRRRADRRRSTRGRVPAPSDLMSRPRTSPPRSLQLTSDSRDGRARVLRRRPRRLRARVAAARRHAAHGADGVRRRGGRRALPRVRAAAWRERTTSPPRCRAMSRRSRSCSSS